MGALLDTVYGEGSGAALARHSDLSRLFAGAETAIRELENPDGSLVVSTVWTAASGEAVGRSTQVCRPKRIHYTELRVAEAWRGKGLYRALVMSLTPLYASWRVEALTAIPFDQRSEWLLAMAGFHPLEWQEERYFACLLSRPCRVSEWREWQAAGAPASNEPAWHKRVRESEVPGEEAY